MLAYKSTKFAIKNDLLTFLFNIYRKNMTIFSFILLQNLIENLLPEAKNVPAFRDVTSKNSKHKNKTKI